MSSKGKLVDLSTIPVIDDYHDRQKYYQSLNINPTNYMVGNIEVTTTYLNQERLENLIYDYTSSLIKLH